MFWPSKDCVYLPPHLPLVMETFPSSSSSSSSASSASSISVQIRLLWGIINKTEGPNFASALQNMVIQRKMDNKKKTKGNQSYSTRLKKKKKKSRYKNSRHIDITRWYLNRESLVMLKRLVKRRKKIWYTPALCVRDAVCRLCYVGMQTFPLLALVFGGGMPSLLFADHESRLPSCCAAPEGTVIDKTVHVDKVCDVAPCWAKPTIDPPK